MRALTLFTVLLLLSAVSHADERPLYSARETIQRAQVGTASPRVAPPVRVEVPAEALRSETVTPSRYERRDCRVDPSKPLGSNIICETRKD